MNRLELRKEGDARVSIHSMNDFEDALLGPRGELDSWLECKNEEEVRLHIGKLMQLSVVDIEYELDVLRAKIAEIEKQEPVAFAVYSGWARKAVYLSELEACEQRDRRQLTADLGGSLEAYRVVPLYTLLGAKGEEK